jgi:hypothetical protein
MVDMSRVEEIERAIRRLSPDEFADVAQWICELQQERWDRQLDADAAAGKLDFLREEARAELGDFPKVWP